MREEGETGGEERGGERRRRREEEELERKGVGRQTGKGQSRAGKKK